MHILVLEPYYGGSHRAFLKDLQRHLPYSFDFLTMPARSWKWRMRLAAPCFAEMLQDDTALLQKADCLLCSTFVDVALLRALLPAGYRDIPILTYFHENQFAYPVQVDDERDLHFAVTNLSTALASDRLAFNSRYNLDTFLRGCEGLLKAMPDMRFADFRERILAKTSIIRPGIDFSGADALNRKKSDGAPPVLVWNHRWEHDKNPEFFFSHLFRLQERGVDFSLLVLGQSFSAQPPIFSQAQERLAHRLVHFGFVEEKARYLELLHQGDVVVSTATHEFYGIAVIEAVRCGCRPLLPGRLSYPELFSDEYLYDDDSFAEALQQAMARGRLTGEESQRMTGSYSWPYLLPLYRDWFEGGWG